MKIILEIMVKRLGAWVVLIRIRPTRCIWLVYIVKNRVGIILIEWGRCEIWIHIRIERIVIVEFQFTNNHKKKEKSNNKQKEKKNQNQANKRVDLDLDFPRANVY